MTIELDAVTLKRIMQLIGTDELKEYSPVDIVDLAVENLHLEFALKGKVKAV